jgi:hypothetical protein
MARRRAKLEMRLGIGEGEERNQFIARDMNLQRKSQRALVAPRHKGGKKS